MTREPKFWTLVGAGTGAGALVGSLAVWFGATVPLQGDVSEQQYLVEEKTAEISELNEDVETLSKGVEGASGLIGYLCDIVLMGQFKPEDISYVQEMYDITCTTEYRYEGSTV